MLILINYALSMVRRMIVKAWEYRKIPLEQRVFMRIVKDEQSGCHLFTGNKDSHGYGQIKDRGSCVLVHRWMWERANGRKAGASHILHRCDTPSCVNPEHLYAGTHGDNMKDKKLRGRSKNVPSGAAHPRAAAKVTEQVVREIKNLLSRGYRQCDIAADFRVSRQLVSDIALHKTWGHLT